MTPSARRFVVRGRVQGVGFRAFTARRALRLGLTGWVTNRSDGTVEGWAEGDDGALDALEEALRVGPPTSRVDRCTVEEVSPTGYTSFDIRR